MVKKDEIVSYYDVLGVRRNASQENIQLAFRQMAKKLHPDVGGSPGAMATLTRAYKVLSDPVKRKRYDESLDNETVDESRQPTAEDLINQEKVLVSEAKKSGGKPIAVGLVLLVIGLIITVASYNAADAGGTYLLAWGPIVFGLISFARGFYRVLAPYSLLHKVYDSEGYRHKFFMEPNGQSSRAVGITVAVVIGISIITGVVVTASSGYGTENAESPSPTSSSNESYYLKTKYDECVAEFGVIESDLESVNSSMDSYEAVGNTYAYNSLVDRQNDLASKYTTKYDECETYRVNYNSSIGQ